jgi:hypothetical protein
MVSIGTCSILIKALPMTKDFVLDGQFSIQMRRLCNQRTFFIPKLMKIRWSSLFFGSFASLFQIELGTHSSNLNSKFVIMSELKFFLLMGVLTQNFNTMDLLQFLEKNQKLHI